jgi:serine/threonine-protein kinase
MSNMASALVAPGAVVAGKYRLDAIVGEGGMGAVWSATHTGLGQAVAIKFINKEFVTSTDALRRFDAEAKAAAQLRSRHVVQVFDNGTLEDGTPYIAMELLRGENLYARVHRAGPIPLPEAVEILAQCCRALGRAHGAGIIHRDIKPDNIFLAQSEDEPLLVKILDFGIAKFNAGPNDHGATRTGAVVGTPLYMSPEQARGLKTIDYRTDIYSLGLVAYTMLTGNLAFSSESFGDLLLQICTAPLPSLCAGAPWLPPSMETWFQRACAREPAMRFATAQEFAEALRGASEIMVRASALPASMQAMSVPRQGAIGGVGANSSGGFQAVTGHPAHAQSVGTDAAMSRSGGGMTGGVPGAGKSKAPIIAAAILGLLVLAGGGAFFALKGSRASANASPPPPATPAQTTATPAQTTAPPPATALGAEAAATLAPETRPAPSSSAALAGAVPHHEPPLHMEPPVPSGHAPGRVVVTGAQPGTGGQSAHPPPAGTSKAIDLGY